VRVNKLQILPAAAVFFAFSMAPLANAKGHGVNCKEQYNFSQRKIELTADVLKKVSGSVKLDPQVNGQVDKWTTVTLAQEGALCNAYREADEAAFPTTRYLDELDKLRQWDESFLEMVLKYTAACEQAQQKKGQADMSEVKTDLQRLVNNLPQLEVPQGKKK
jgi:hypothetical protein